MSRGEVRAACLGVTRLFREMQTPGSPWHEPDPVLVDRVKDASYTIQTMLVRSRGGSA